MILFKYNRRNSLSDEANLYKQNQCINKNALFGVYYELEKTQVQTFLRIKLAKLLLLMVIVI